MIISFRRSGWLTISIRPFSVFNGHCLLFILKLNFRQKLQTFPLSIRRLSLHTQCLLNPVYWTPISFERWRSSKAAGLEERAFCDELALKNEERQKKCMIIKSRNAESVFVINIGDKPNKHFLSTSTFSLILFLIEKETTLSERELYKRPTLL